MSERIRSSARTTIDPAAHVMTLVNVFTVEPANQQRLIDLLVEATEHTMKRLSGFVSANIHRSADGTKVINYAQWRSAQDFDAMRQHPEAARHMQEASSLAKVDPIVCEVVASMTAAEPDLEGGQATSRAATGR